MFLDFLTLKVLIYIPKANIYIYVDKLADVYDKFNRKFGGFDKLVKILSIVRSQFCTEIDSAPNEIQLDLIDLRCNKTSQELYKKEEHSDFYDFLNTA